MSPCVTFPVLKAKDLKQMFIPLPKDHDPTNKMAAMEKAYSKEPAYSGIFYQVQKTTLEDHLKAEIDKSCKSHLNNEPYTIEDILNSFV